MSIQSKLFNPTPWDISLTYEKGITLLIPSDGHLELTMQQLDDYRPGKPGSEEVKKTLDFHGLFLRDPDLSFDSQALLALTSSYEVKKRQKETFTTTIQNSRAASGRQLDDDTLDALVASSGYGPDGLGGQIEDLKKRIDMLREATVSMPQRLEEAPPDPDLTCFGTSPPRSFETKLQLLMFMSNQPPEVIEKHEAFQAALEEAKANESS